MGFNEYGLNCKCSQVFDRRQTVVKKIGFLAFLLLPPAIVAQSTPAATGGEASISAGVEMSIFNPDWDCSGPSPFCSNDLIGPTAVFEFDLHRKYGFEGEARWLNFHGQGNFSEQNYLAGPHYRFVQFHRLSGWVKVDLGGGWIQTPYYPAAGSLKGSYFVYAPGGTLNYRLTHKLTIRGDYEYQIWPSFAGPPTYNSMTGTVNPNDSGLSPNGFSLGVMYRILGP